MENPELYAFYGYWQLFVCTFSAIALFAIWRHLTGSEDESEKDYGLLWLAAAVLMWAFTGIVDIYAAQELQYDAAIYEGGRSILSLLNSAFILLALPCFKHIPFSVRPILHSRQWNLLVLITFVFSVVMTSGMLIGIFVPKTTSWIYGVDVFFGIFTLFFLTLVLWESFDKRNLRTLAVLSVVCIVFTVAAQFFKLGDSEFWKLCFSATFKTILIMLFFALMFSWVEEISKTYLPKPAEMYLVLLKKRIGTKFEYLAILTIPPKIQTKKIVFTEKPYQLLRTFAQRRLEASNEKEGWLEMIPKSTPQKKGDIKDYNEISRILNTILDETMGVKNWTKEDRSYLRQTLLEYPNNRKFRLRIKPENITLEEAVENKVV